MRIVILKGVSIGHMQRIEAACCFNPGGTAHGEHRVEGFQRPALEAQTCYYSCEVQPCAAGQYSRSGLCAIVHVGDEGNKLISSVKIHLRCA